MAYEVLQYRLWRQDWAMLSDETAPASWGWEVFTDTGQVLASGTAPSAVRARIAAFEFCVGQGAKARLANPVDG